MPDFGTRRGPSINPARELQRARQLQRRTLEHVHSIKAGLVETYDHATQTVTVSDMWDVKAAPYTNVPIRRGLGGGSSKIYPLVGRTQVQSGGEPDTGFLLFIDSGDGPLMTKDRRRSQSGTSHAPVPACFVPAAPVQGDDVPELFGAATNRIGDGDLAFTWGTAAIIIRKDRGDGKSQIVLVADDIVGMKSIQGDGDLKEVAREGDAGDGGPGVGPISGTGLIRSGPS